MTSNFHPRHTYYSRTYNVILGVFHPPHTTNPDRLNTSQISTAFDPLPACRSQATKPMLKANKSGDIQGCNAVIDHGIFKHVSFAAK